MIGTRDAPTACHQDGRWRPRLTSSRPGPAQGDAPRRGGARARRAAGTGASARPGGGARARADRPVSAIAVGRRRTAQDLAQRGGGLAQGARLAADEDVTGVGPRQKAGEDVGAAKLVDDLGRTGRAAGGPAAIQVPSSDHLGAGRPGFAAPAVRIPVRRTASCPRHRSPRHGAAAFARRSGRRRRRVPASITSARPGLPAASTTRSIVPRCRRRARMRRGSGDPARSVERAAWIARRRDDDPTGRSTLLVVERDGESHVGVDHRRCEGRCAATARAASSCSPLTTMKTTAASAGGAGPAAVSVISDGSVQVDVWMRAQQRPPVRHRSVPGRHDCRIQPRIQTAIYTVIDALADLRERVVPLILARQERRHAGATLGERLTAPQHIALLSLAEDRSPCRRWPRPCAAGQPLILEGPGLQSAQAPERPP